jgi:O-antigen ligase
VLVGLVGSNPFPRGAVVAFMFAWTLLAILIELIREPGNLGSWIAGPVLLTVALAVLMVARLGASADGDYGGRKLLLFCTANLTLLVAASLIGRSARHFDLFVYLMFAVAVASAIVLLRAFVAGSPEEIFDGRFALSTEENPIELGRRSAIGIILGVYVLLAARTVWPRVLALGLLPLLGVALIAAGTRGPVLGLAVGLLLFVLLTLRDPATRRRLLLLVAAGFGAALLVPELVPGQTIERAASLLLSGGAGLSSNGRLELWSQARDIFVDHPFLGIGTGGFAGANPEFVYPHNLWLEVAVELGLLGLLLLAATLVYATVRIVGACLEAEGEARGRIALVVALLAMALLNSLLSGDIATNRDVWLTLGLGVGLAASASAQRRADSSAGRWPVWPAPLPTAPRDGHRRRAVP